MSSGMMRCRAAQEPGWSQPPKLGWAVVLARRVQDGLGGEHAFVVRQLAEHRTVRVHDPGLTSQPPDPGIQQVAEDAADGQQRADLVHKHDRHAQRRA